jgi:hypothetical protein
MNRYILGGFVVQFIGYATVGYLTNSIMIPFMLLWIHLGRAICKKGV